MKHTISGLVRNRTGILARLVGTFSEFDINIKSVAVSETDEFDTSRATIVVEGHDREVRKVTQKLKKTRDVIQVDDLSSEEFVERELAMIKVSYRQDNLSQLLQMAEVYGAEVDSVGKSTVTMEITGNDEKVEGLIHMLAPFGVRAIARTGRVALKRGDGV